jgi:hypothetical protein
MFKSLIAIILIIVLFLKTMLIMDFDDFLVPLFLASFRPPPPPQISVVHLRTLRVTPVENR